MCCGFRKSFSLKDVQALTMSAIKGPEFIYCFPKWGALHPSSFKGAQNKRHARPPPRAMMAFDCVPLILFEGTHKFLGIRNQSFLGFQISSDFPKQFYLFPSLFSFSQMFQLKLKKFKIFHWFFVFRMQQKKRNKIIFILHRKKYVDIIAFCFPARRSGQTSKLTFVIAAATKAPI